MMLGTFQMIFPKWQLPQGIFSQLATTQMCNFPIGNFPSLSQPHCLVLSLFQPRCSAPYPILATALGPHCSLRCLIGPNLNFGKILLGKYLTPQIKMLESKFTLEFENIKMLLKTQRAFKYLPLILQNAQINYVYYSIILPIYPRLESYVGCRGFPHPPLDQ